MNYAKTKPAEAVSILFPNPISSVFSQKKSSHLPSNPPKLKKKKINN